MGGYKKLMSIRYNHQYYKDKVCPDLITTPTAECQQLMRNHKLVFKALENGFDMFYMLEDGTSVPLVPLDTTTELTFNLTMRNADFYTYTVLDDRLLKTHHLEYTNGESDGNLYGQWVPISQENRKKSVIAQLVFSDLDWMMEEVDFDLDYRINFESTESKWTYYIVLPKANPIPNYIIQDEDPEAGASRYGTLTFEAPETVQLTNGATALKIVSTEAIPAMKESKKKIQLYDSDEEEVLQDNLPNPQANLANFEVYIYV